MTYPHGEIPPPMVESDVTMALAELRWIPQPNDSTKSRCLADLKRQGIPLRSVVAFLKAHPQIDWWLAMNEVKKPSTTSQRGEAVKSRTKEEIERENDESAERERTETAKISREEMVKKLASYGIRVESRRTGPKVQKGEGDE